MSPTLADRPRIRHKVRGRLRVHVPGLAGSHPQAVEERLGRLAGVRGVRANSLTGNVLIHFDPATTEERALLAELHSPALDAVEAAAGFDLPSLEAPAGRPSLLGGVLRLVSAAVGVGLLALQRLGLGMADTPAGRGLATAAGTVGFLASVPPVRAALHNLLGPTTAELLSHLTDLLGHALNGNTLLLAFRAVGAVLTLGQALAGTP